ncbi:MAG TPA: hypothetical protein VMQ93_15700 [Novosphingobium sp.]|nr:hypothetical protein [Novosphingobium sp.]
MYNAFDIVKKNAATFYNFRTGKSVSVAYRYVLLAVLAAFGVSFFKAVSVELYSSFISAQSILVGFSFNVMVYLASTDALRADDPSVLEDVAKVKKLNRLAEEIHTNLSYFNLVALLSIFVSLLLTLSKAYDADTAVLASWVGEGYRLLVSKAAGVIVTVIKSSLIWLAYATLLESLATFVRVTKRVTYFFAEKRKLGQSLG